MNFRKTLKLVIFSLLIFFNQSCYAGKLNVVIKGVDEQVQNAIKKDLSIYQALGEKDLDDSRIQTLNYLAEKEIKRILSTLGYYTPKIKSALKENKQQWTAQYNIELGEPVIINQIDVMTINNTGVRFDYTLPKDLQVGQIIAIKNYDKFKNDLLIKAIDNGFLSAEFEESKLLINIDDNTCNVIIKLNLGKLYTFGTVTYNNSELPDWYIKGYENFQEGEQYTTSKVIQFQKNLNNSNYFSKVRIDPEPDLENLSYTDVPLNIRLTDKPANRFTVSAGYDSDILFNTQINYRHLFYKLPGHRLNLVLQLSQKANQVGGTYTIDGRNPLTDKWIFFGNLYNQKLNNKKTIRKEIGGGYQSVIKAIIKYEIGARYLNEKSDIVDDNLPQVTGYYLLPYISLSWKEFTEIDDWVYGTALEYKIQTTINKAFSSNNFMQNKFSIKHVNGISDTSRLIARADLGFNSKKNVDNLPFGLRFFAGGMNSIRGYGFNNVGPFVLNNSGDVVVIGGSKLFTGSLEFEQMVKKPFSLAIFTDFGNAMNKWNTKLVKSIGLGIRYNTKLGPLKLDVAYPLDKIAPNNFKRLPRFDVSFGFEF